MKTYTITVNGTAYSVTVEEGTGSAAPVAAPAAAPKAAPAAAPAAPASAGLSNDQMDILVRKIIEKLQNA